MDINNQESIFEMIDNTTEPSTRSKLDVVRADFVDTLAISWQDLFHGFNKIKVITFSSGINFMYQLFDMFENVEIIFGCENVISSSIQDIFAYQTKLMENIRKSDTRKRDCLLQRINNGSVHLFVARTQISHEKIYILEANDGRKRVITGSANMSFNAFSGKQRENIIYMDGERAFNWYSNIFDDFKTNCADNINHNAILFGDCADNLTELPISQSVRQKAIIIEQTDKNEDIQFVLDVKNLSKNLTHIVPTADKNNRILLTPDTITRTRRLVTEDIQKEKELRAEYPQLVVDVKNKKALLNNTTLNLSPSKEDIKQDVELFISYMEGYNKFHGDYTSMQYRYYEFANWFFCSPFMATMRDAATIHNQNKLPYPVFGLVYGQSKAGKTSFLETLLKMMIGQKPKISAPDFTRKTICDLKNTVEGAPIIVDDLTNQRFNMHAIETIKDDDFGCGEHNLHYPAVVISANEDVKAVAPEIIRRTVICRVNAGLTNTEVIKSNVVRATQQKIGTAFYREYLRRMLDIIPDLLKVLSDDHTDTAPDILSCSSKVLKAIISEFIDVTPAYVRELSLESYFSEHVTGQHSIQKIKEAWRINKHAFKISKKHNEIQYDAEQTYEADRIIKELPETLEARKSRGIIIMNLEEAKKFFGINFKKGIL